VEIVGTDEHGAIDITEHDLTGPTVVVVGNETAASARRGGSPATGWHASR
jgi:hypothetical protein